MLVQPVALVDGVRVGLREAVGGEQAVADARPHLIALVGQQAARLVAVGLREVRAVLVQAVAGEHLVEQHQPPEIAPRRLGEERRQPDQGIRRHPLADELPDLRQIVARRMSRLVEGPVDHDPPRALVVAEVRGRHLPDVAEQDLASPPGAPPRHLVALLLRQQIRGVGKADALVEELAHLLHPVPVVVEGLRVLQDALGVHPDDP